MVFMGRWRTGDTDDRKQWATDRLAWEQERSAFLEDLE